MSGPGADPALWSEGSRKALQGVHPLGSVLLRSGEMTSMAGRLDLNVFQKEYLVQLFPYRNSGLIQRFAVCAS